MLEAEGVDRVNPARERVASYCFGTHFQNIACCTCSLEAIMLVNGNQDKQELNFSK